MAVVVLLVLAATTSLGAVARGPIDEGSVLNDFDRDLLGAVASQRGESPYQRLGAIDGTLTGPMGDEWVAHTPGMVALARTALSIAGDREGAARLATGVAVALWLAVAAGGVLKRQYWVMGACLAAVATVSFAHSVEWAQHSLAFAAGLTAALWADSAGLRLVARAVLGVLVALKPWLLPLAVCLPNSTSATRDIASIGAIAGVVSVLGSLALGGLDVLFDWAVVASPANIEQYRLGRNSFSLVGGLPAEIAAVASPLASLVVLPRLRTVTSGSIALLGGWLVAVSLSPVVWPHYLVDLSPVLVAAAFHDEWTRGRLPAVILLSTTAPSLFSGQWPHLYYVAAVGARSLAIVLVTVAVLAAMGRRWLGGGLVVDNALTRVLGLAEVQPTGRIGREPVGEGRR